MTRQSSKSEYLEPCTVPESFVTGLCQYSQPIDKHTYRLAIGTHLRILRGPFAGASGIVQWSSRDRVRLLSWLC
jgi:hypothetical protein